MNAVILAAGKGTRLKPYSDILPKPLMPIELDASGGFRTIIERLVSQIVAAGVTGIVVAVNYKAAMIMEALGDGEALGARIAYVHQSVLDGNAGAFHRARHFVRGDDVIVTDSDNLISDDAVFRKMRELHERERPAVTVGVCRVDDVRKFAIVKMDASGKAVDIFEKPQSAEGWGNLAKSGLMILSAETAALDPSAYVAPNGEYTTTQIIKHCIDAGKKVSLFDIEGGFKDIGTWGEYLPVLRAALGG
ncbi:MAG: nucleotidyltransferase family protein [Spirochaetes bacterium]|nr:nucleotidyltransferase family protein [Spirochaetota bacterium]